MNLYKRAKKYSMYRYIFGIKCWCATEKLMTVDECDFLYDDKYEEPLLIGYRK